jgi:hypothetical protein
MSWVAVAVAGGSALIGAGGSITGGLLSSGAAKDASAAQQDAANRGITTLQAGQRDALNYLDPFRQFGLNAGYTLQDSMYSPEQRAAQMDQQRLQFTAEVDRLKALVPKWETYQTFTGKNASERRRDAFTAEHNAALQKVAEAESKLKSFNQRVDLTKAQVASGVNKMPEMQESPWYKFQSELLGRNMDRFFAARGLTGSGFEAEERRRGLIELGAGETERQYSRLFNMYGTGANAANAGAGALTGTSQGMANMQVGAGQAQAQGIIGANQGIVDAITGGVNAVNAGVGGALNYKMFQNLMANNKPTGGVTPRGVDPVFDSVDSGRLTY